MAWDTARTKQLLLDAAVEEFAAYGPEGARVARIATRAGINKERIYTYFGNKDQLFATVLDSELQKAAAAVPLTPEQAADLGDFAGRVYDYHHRHPHFARLLAWEGLHYRGEVAAERERTAHYCEKIAAVTGAQQSGTLTDDLDAGALVRAVIALTASWFTLPQLAHLLTPAAAKGPSAAQRELLVGLVRHLTT
ncbi:TetR family transcriptional regulator [Streptomyces gilvosporeus]|uniref:TetR family transcriptional regulator n=1 Tax=Streptomyces gilvosporeus TaxID=553510 RepID=A0A1V0TS91_9ACTN|nr:TetR family transcriptional regulator [Streptomyces gilvosporeus]ARF55720.1 TetR family transcriptional regulator [Streptomyces gilvosporeus]